MDLYRWIFLAGFGVFLTSAFYSLTQILVLHYSDRSGPGAGIGRITLHSLTTSISSLIMQPVPSRSVARNARRLCNTGTLLSFALAFLHYFNLSPGGDPGGILALLLAFTAAGGTALLAVRIAGAGIRRHSRGADYAGNLLAVGFQVLSLLVLAGVEVMQALFVYTTVLFLYLTVFSRIKFRPYPS